MVCLLSIFDYEKKMSFNRLCHLKRFEFIRIKESINDNKEQFCWNFLSAFFFVLFFFEK